MIFWEYISVSEKKWANNDHVWTQIMVSDITLSYECYAHQTIWLYYVNPIYSDCIVVTYCNCNLNSKVYILWWN